jgi:hypothetical protein
MHGKLKRKRLRRERSLKHWTVTFLAAVLTYVLLIATQRRGVPKKWVTAIVGTLAPFSLVIYAFRRWLLRWTFWASLAMCFAVHITLVWIFFQYILSSVQTFSIWLWLPVMLIEAFVLLIIVKRLEEKLTGKHETIRLSF